MKESIKKMSAMLTMMALAILSLTLTACGDDNDDETADELTKAVAYQFALSFADVDMESDQADLITTTYSFINHRGEEEGGEFCDQFVDNMTIKSQKYTTLPGEVEIVVTETLNPDVELTKDKYTVGLKLALAVNSSNKNGDVVDMASTASGSGLTIPAANLSKIYPKTHHLKFTVDRNGKITIK